MIGQRLATRLRSQGHWVRGVDIAPPGRGADVDEFIRADLRDPSACAIALDPLPDTDDREIWHLAAVTGPIASSGDALADNVRIDANVASSAVRFDYRRLLYASSTAAATSVANGAEPATRGLADNGWSKLTGERIVAAVADRVPALVARLGSCYGPEEDAQPGSVTDLCRRVADASSGDTLEVTAGVEQAFLWVDDAIEALLILMESSQPAPVNIVGAELTTPQQLAELLCQVSGKTLRLATGPAMMPCPGNLDDSAITNLGWRPTTALAEGVRRLYEMVDEAKGT